MKIQKEQNVQAVLSFTTISAFPFPPSVVRSKHSYKGMAETCSSAYSNFTLE